MTDKPPDDVTLDDVTKLRLQREQDSVVAATANFASSIDDLARADVSTEVFTAELDRILGVPSHTVVGATPTATLIGFICGSMIARGYSVEAALAIVDAVADATETEPYDLSTIDRVRGRIERISGPEVDDPDGRRYCAVLEWARLARLCVLEFYFKLEDCHDDPLEHPGAELRRRAHEATRFIANYSYGIISASHG